MGRLLVKTHGTDESSRAATEATLMALPRGGPFMRNPDGSIFVDAVGFCVCECVDPHFVKFAIDSQGYAKQAIVLG